MNIETYKPPKIKHFINRRYELSRLASAVTDGSVASLIFVYGRRRVGKTALLEKAFTNRRLLKFEGLEGRTEQQQRDAVMRQLARYAQDDLISRLTIKTWEDVFHAIHRYVDQGQWTVYFEEVQWLANYKRHFITELKLFWDNHFSQNLDLVMILCGSSPAYMVQEVVRSKALYNRATLELPVHAFSLDDLEHFLPKTSTKADRLEAYLTVGGIPPYLNMLRKYSSTFLGLCNESFVQGGFFVGEYERLLVSSLSADPVYKRILAFLAKKRFATRSEIEQAAHLSSGGSTSRYFEELELCGFIESYTSFHLKSGRNLMRYSIADPYLQFYFRFIEPIRKDVESGTYNHSPTTALSRGRYQQWLGYAFERFCRTHHRQIARILGFDAIEYQHGPYFRRSGPASEPHMQIDLCFMRADKTLTVCEIKHTQAPSSKDVGRQFSEKLERVTLPKAKRIERVLISTSGATDGCTRYFDRIISLDDLFLSIR